MSFKYLCTNCNKPAHKDPISKYDPIRKTGGTLGSWHCGGACKGKVKVKRRNVGGENA